MSRIYGVYDVTSGYANGNKDNPTYEEVGRGNTKFAETVHVQYDPEMVSLETLLTDFFKVVDPTSQNKQGNDGRLISNEKKLNMSMSSDMMKQQWYVNAIHSNNMPVLTKARMQNFSMDKDNWVISVSQEIRDPKGNNLGVLLIDVKYKIIDNFLNDLNVSDQDYVFILNHKN